MNNTESFVRQHADTVYRLAYAQLRTKHDADDVFQEVFLRYLRKRPRFESPEHARAWLIRVTLNCCKNVWRSPWQKAEPLPSGLAFPQPEEAHLDEALRLLPEKYRAVLHLHYYEGYTTEEIAAILGRRPGTVRSQLARGREKLACLLKGEPFA